MKLAEALKIAKPILFNTEMVWAIQNGTKTVTRRVVKPKYTNTKIILKNGIPFETVGTPATSVEIKSPYEVGDILYVRETWQYVDEGIAGDDNAGYVYKASENSKDWETGSEDWKWRPSIHMPKEAARIFLRVTDVRVERLQDSFFKSGSTILSLLREGFDMHKQCREDIDVFYGSPHCRAGKDECSILSKVRSDYADLWNSTVKESDLDKFSWAANPWVWIIEFERIEVTG